MKTATELLEKINSEMPLEVLFEIRKMDIERMIEVIYSYDHQSREKYKEKPLFVFEKDDRLMMNEEYRSKVAQFLKDYGYFMYGDPVYGSYPVYPDDKTCWNPHRTLIEP